MQVLDNIFHVIKIQTEICVILACLQEKANG